MKRLTTMLLAAVLALPIAGISADKAKPAAASAAQADAEVIDINRASAEELATLKGIGEVRAKAIVKGRPYARKDDLVKKKIIPQSVYDEIREQIVAKQG